MYWSDQKAYTHKTAIKGKAGVSKAWLKEKGDRPTYILVRAEGDGPGPVVLTTFVKQDDQPYTGFLITQKQLTDLAPGATSTEVDLKYRAAGFWARLWYTGTLWAITVDIIGGIAAVVAAVIVYSDEIDNSSLAQHGASASTPRPLIFLALFVVGCTFLAAVLKLIKDARGMKN